MSLTVYTGTAWSVNRNTISLNAGSIAPRVLSAVSIDTNTVRVTFDHNMAMGYDLSPSAPTTLNASSYTVRNTDNGTYLSVMLVQRYSDTEVDLTVLDQLNVEYELKCLTAQDSYGTEIDAVNNTALFTGTAYDYPSTENLNIFTGLYSGIQFTPLSGLSPDLSPPYVQNADPADLEGEVARDKVLYLEICDSDNDVNLSTVAITITINGNPVIAYDGSTDSFDTAYSGPSSERVVVPNGYGFYIQRANSTEWPSYELINLHVSAEDGNGNLCDHSYNFRIEDWVAPYVQNTSPVNLEDEVSKNKVLYLELCDDDSGVNLSTATITITIDATPIVAYDGSTDTFNIAYRGPASERVSLSNGFGFYIQRTDSTEWPSYKLINLNVAAEDEEGNLCDYSYSFRIEDYAAPIWPLYSPTGSNVDKNSSVFASISDEEGVGVNANKISCTIDGTSAIVDGVFQSGFSGTIVADGTGYDVTVNKSTDYDSFSEVEVEFYAEDMVGNSSSQSWMFKIVDYIAPTWPIYSPTGSDKDKYTPVSVSIRDEAGSGVNSNKISSIIGGRFAIVDGVFQSGFSGTIVPSGSGYDVTVNTSIEYGSFADIEVEFYAEDIAGNSSSQSWLFKVEDYEGVLIIPVNPQSGQINVNRSTNIYIRFYDDDAVLTSTVKVEVDIGEGYVTVFENEEFEVGWDGPNSFFTYEGNGYYGLLVDPMNSFPSDSVISVRVTALDPSGNPERTS